MKDNDLNITESQIRCKKKLGLICETNHILRKILTNYSFLWKLEEEKRKTRKITKNYYKTQLHHCQSFHASSLLLKYNDLDKSRHRKFMNRNMNRTGLMLLLTHTGSVKIRTSSPPRLIRKCIVILENGKT